MKSVKFWLFMREVVEQVRFRGRLDESYLTNFRFSMGR